MTPAIVAAGLCCPLGLRLAPAAAAIRAGIDRFRESRYRDDHGEPIVTSSLSTLAPELSRGERVVRLLAGAIADVAGSSAQLAGMPLFLGTGQSGATSELVEPLRKLLAAEYGLELGPEVHVHATGSTAGLRALAAARSRVEHERGAALVAAGDSLVNAASLSWLDDQARLKRADNSDGVIPGEAAACVVVRGAAVDRSRAIGLAGLGFATETATLASDEPLLGAGIVAATRAALGEAKLSLAEIDVRLSDAAGESYAFKEQALLLGRLLRDRHEPIVLRLPAESLGDTGAAAGLVALVLGIAELSAPRQDRRRALILASDVAGDRAAAVLTRA